MTTDDLDEGRRKLQILEVVAKTCIVFVVVCAVAAMVEFLWEPFIFGDGGYVAFGDDFALLYADIALLVSAVPVAMWIYRAHANLQAADFLGLEYTPGWSVGWFFVPIAALWKPFSAMRELWNASHGAIGGYSDNAPALLWVWWLGYLFSNLGGFDGDDYTLDVLALAAQIASAGALWAIIGAVTRRQNSISFGLNEVFA